MGDSGLDQRRRYRAGPRVVQFIFQVRMGKAHPGEELKGPASRGRRESPWQSLDPFLEQVPLALGLEREAAWKTWRHGWVLSFP